MSGSFKMLLLGSALLAAIGCGEPEGTAVTAEPNEIDKWVAENPAPPMKEIDDVGNDE